MPRFDGSLAVKLDFGEMTTTTMTAATGRRGLRLAAAAQASGPDKYRELAHRRRQAQIRARRLLDLLD
jgi:hypothetical protein